jgi:hypothetical protein
MVNLTIDSSAITALRYTLDELFTDHRFIVRQWMSAGQVADYILTQLQHGECDRELSNTRCISGGL